MRYLIIVLTISLNIIFSAPFSTIFAQHQPIVTENSHRIVTYWNAPFLNPHSKFSWSIKGDTIVAGQGYKKVYTENFYYDENTGSWPTPYQITSTFLTALLREDTTTKKVYCIQANDFLPTCPENEEFLLYDFGQTQGDTLNWCVLDNWPSDYYGNHTFVVDSISNAYLGASAIYTTGMFGTWGLLFISEQAIIPGFGFENFGLFLKNPPGEIEIDVIKCVGTNTDCNIATATTNLNTPNLQIHPNPVNNLLFLNYASHPKSKEDTNFFITDITGRVSHASHFGSGSHQLDVSHLSSGTYFISFRENGKHYNYRFVKY